MNAVQGGIGPTGPSAGHLCMTQPYLAIRSEFRAILLFGLSSYETVVNTFQGHRNCLKTSPESLAIRCQCSQIITAVPHMSEKQLGLDTSGDHVIGAGKAEVLAQVLKPFSMDVPVGD